MFEEKKVLVLSPHPDDAELGVGGTIAKLVERKNELFWSTFSWCKESMKDGMNIEKELHESLKVLGVNKKNLFTYDFKVRHFPKVRQEILEELIKLRKDVSPDVIIVPSSFDVHQDHSTISKEAFRAFKHFTILGFEEPWNDKENTYNFFSELNESHLQKKINAIKCYTSQNKRTYATSDYLKSLATMRGQQVNVKYAEALEAIRLVSKVF